MSRQHAAASVPGNVPGQRGQRGDLPDGHEEHVQPQTGGPQKVRPEGEAAALRPVVLGRVSNPVLLQGSLVDREASDKERVRSSFSRLSSFLLRAGTDEAGLPAAGERAAHLQGHGLQEQHAEGVRE